MWLKGGMGHVVRKGGMGHVVRKGLMQKGQLCKKEHVVRKVVSIYYKGIVNINNIQELKKPNMRKPLL